MHRLLAITFALLILPDPTESLFYTLAYAEISHSRTQRRFAVAMTVCGHWLGLAVFNVFNERDLDYCFTSGCQHKGSGSVSSVWELRAVLEVYVYILAVDCEALN